MGDPSLGVYLHVPFCERICPYCDFAVVRARPLSPEVEARYVAALLAELAQRAAEFAPRRLETVYFGGGTPSLLSAASVARLLAAAQRTFPGGAPAEVTLEVNPSTVERGRLPAFRDAGVTRLSVGIQSFGDTVLRRLGRAHRADEGRRTLAAARAAGFTNVSLDLLFAAPGEDEAALARDLDEALAFAPEHVSAYGLTIETGTPFARAAARGQLRLPDEETAARMLETVAARLESAGLGRYEISNFARPGFESRHNLRYWERRAVLGLGAGAVSCEPPGPGAPHGARRANPRDLAGYLEGAGRGDAKAEREVLAAPTARGEAALLALRTAAGLRAGGFADEFGAPPRAFWSAEIDALVAQGMLVEVPCGDLRLTPRGVMLSDSVFEGFV